MTSSGLKRPLDFELPNSLTNNDPNDLDHCGELVANINKRRCTSAAPESRVDPPTSQCNSPFKDPSTIITPLVDDISSLIRDEVRRTQDNRSNAVDEAPILTIRQTQMICEKLIKEREQKLRDEYDKILISKLAEQYETFVKYTHHSFSANGHPSALTSPHLAYNLQQQAAVAAIQAQHLRASTTPNSLASGPVLLASNLDEQLATPEALFTLFGVFGDVMRVKILFNKKDNALIQMADANQAQVAQGYLDRNKVFGKTIRVTRSKHQLVQMPRDGNQSEAGLTKDFTNSPLHRFKIPGSRNYLNIYPPSNTLHISNIPATIEESDIHRAFKEACGFDYASFKFFPKDRKMALIKFSTIEHATIALIKMHNYSISTDNKLRVSFSKSVMQQ